MYIVSVADMCGVFEEYTHASFDDALACFKHVLRAHKGKKYAVCIHNKDQCDYQSNGLTYDECEAVDMVQV